mmetsp:Transcript_13551/g.20143  ORF Transcript_13551/g.20143 Transcript_13551/m.20143 type:complete len:721 (-) Transcript_13551:354-2516(-)|eukprot:CAMPEP_0116027878 /NCGR_PEP_ID=MMETSP0321-20121206/14981_1 /TAXON_ID=163516 /ORGANISM="Leptocylindrus danicus var. danicus, Strain B650" /LENGTH=720 /DNA_ID=CAMNT_0003501497 /DNA_START=79 /DNA_END=2241 /DNA_ORIENTATION=+
MSDLPLNVVTYANIFEECFYLRDLETITTLVNGGGIIQEIPNKGRLRGRALVAVLYHVICARPVFPETDEADNDDEGTSQDPVMTQDNDSAPFTQADGQAKTNGDEEGYASARSEMDEDKKSEKKEEPLVPLSKLKFEVWDDFVKRMEDTQKCLELKLTDELIIGGLNRKMGAALDEKLDIEENSPLFNVLKIKMEQMILETRFHQVCSIARNASTLDDTKEVLIFKKNINSFFDNDDNRRSTLYSLLQPPRGNDNELETQAHDDSEIMRVDSASIIFKTPEEIKAILSRKDSLEAYQEKMARFLSTLERKRWPIPMNLIANERYKLQPGYGDAADVADFGGPSENEDIEEEKKDDGGDEGDDDDGDDENDEDGDEDNNGDPGGAVAAGATKLIETPTKRRQTETVQIFDENGQLSAQKITQHPQFVEAVKSIMRKSLTPMKKSRDGEDQEEDDRKRAAKRPRRGDDVEEASRNLKARREQLGNHPDVLGETVEASSHAAEELRKRGGITNTRKKGQQLSFDDSHVENTPAKVPREGSSPNKSVTKKGPQLSTPAPSAARSRASKKSSATASTGSGSSVKLVKKKTFFSEEEVHAVIRGMIKFRGEPNMWAEIRDHYWVFQNPDNVGRSSVQIKDKARNLKLKGVIETLDGKCKDIISRHDDIEEPESTKEAKERLMRAEENEEDSDVEEEDANEDGDCPNENNAHDNEAAEEDPSQGKK